MTNKTRILSAVAVIAIISTVLIAGMQGPDKAYAQQVPYLQQTNTISVTGQASESVTPDLASIQLGVDTQAKSAQNATSQNAQEMNATIAAIENLGITTSEISTSSFTISPIYNNTGPSMGDGGSSNELLGYEVSNRILIQTTQLGLVGNILDAAVGAGANRVDDVSFTLSPQKEQEVKDTLLENAILDAQSRAQKALSPLGQKITGVQTVTLSELNVPPPGPLYQGRFMSAMAMPTTPIFTSSQEITTTVNVTFLIGPQ